MSVLEMYGVVLDSGVESAGQAVFAQVLRGEYAKDLMEMVAFLSPQGPQIGDGVYMSLVVVEGPHEFFFVEL